MQPARKPAFTLIELLVVIAIIAILAAILFPVFATARETARKTLCLSNMKQLALGVRMYSQDYDEMKVPCFIWDFPGGSANQYTWRGLISPYVKDRGIFICPAIQKASSTQSNASRNDGVHDVRGNYGLNWNAGYTCFSPNWHKPWPHDPGASIRREGWLERPSQIIMMTETIGGISYVHDHLVLLPYQGTLYVPPHNRMGNFVFDDGHVQAMRHTRTFGPVGSGWETFLWFTEKAPIWNFGPVTWPTLDQRWLDAYRTNHLAKQHPSY